jgi:hypothetical protein
LSAFSLPGSASGPRAPRTVTCEVCYALVPAHASHCPDCGSVLDRTVAASPLDENQWVPNAAAPKSSAYKWMWFSLAAGVAAFVATIILIRSWWK